MKQKGPQILGLNPVQTLQTLHFTNYTAIAERATHRDVEYLLGLVQHAHPDGYVAAGRHSWRLLARFQRADAQGLRAAQPLPRRGRWLLFHHGLLRSLRWPR